MSDMAKLVDGSSEEVLVGGQQKEEVWW